MPMSPDAAALNETSDAFYRDMQAAYQNEFRRQVMPDGKMAQVTFQLVYLATLMRLAGSVQSFSHIGLS
jgi:hypothetical protein